MLFMCASTDVGYWTLMGSLNLKTVIARTDDSKWKPDKLKSEKNFKTVVGNLIYH